MSFKKIIEKIIPKSLLGLYHYQLALISAFWYGFPSKKLIVIGVTGTKGKSTTVMLAGKILEENGAKVAWLTSATIKIGEKEQLNPYHMTMPGRFAVQQFLKDAVRTGCKFAILEVTSEGIKQHRHKFIDFNTAVFTNLKPEHIEAHGSFENYRFCKGRLFKSTKKNHILNFDDENVEYFMKFPAERKLIFGAKNKQANMVFAENIQESKEGAKFSINNIDFNLKLLGKFNVYNALAAICISISQGESLENCKKALEKIETIPGRMELVIEKPFKVIVDLAHTPDSYEEVFKSVKFLPHNKIISVFGSAGGGRDKWKRPLLGKIAAQNSNTIILTNEDPYDENPEQILSEIKSGILKTGFELPNLYEILDRRKAIKKGLKLAGENDIVLVLGKGTEQLMMVSGKKIPWDDRQITKEELKKLGIGI
ncbi:UDP-N-acetylmuramoyl-L-alanyl-D-glutamate--2,6-diaminopimelate ligase [Patescibacteria group bacterium]|nr:UDP-N-acetylmuramoyl-L-alanyl-D-glutamate--2,6-diaminopimelate ligase [Patescibacteria group bacterium]MBU4274384.1 UDP-N-acetylmuramoyl-L-alanyl-D-glutamate--2,6-diaminopimelate ligase [Patescibacteria group bacterium]MBU4367508.1 UDP-N-acetylmuramoyl-L-alanyl-D-glutamate--2,6-diaminopimelate ligase [Patescibacteria group bacterium]MBU4461549.1 UDP-N-acetylmuramoyl-L-alanyl-D-glutamate--2,6-diaminopimelate ligase [Patescibacteria group bacterium]MCG2699446.1 UDP-N-acetylmuramoyl-L-alanyl-D-